MSQIKKEITSGVFYIGIARYSGIAFQIVVSAILARLLPPSDFGIIAIATVVMAFFNLLSDIGISPAIVQRKELNQSDFNYIFTFTVYVGIVLSVVFFVCSWPISLFYDDKQLLPICQLMSLLLFLSCIRIVPFGLLMRNKEFKYQAFTTLFSNMTGGIIACITAYIGFGVYSLVISFFIPSLLTFISFFVKHPVRFKLNLNINPLKKIFSYSIYVFLFNLVNYFSRNLDKLLVGKYVSLSDLGQYQKSYQLMMMPLNSISDIVTPVLHPIFSEYQSDVQFIKEKYFKFLNFVSYISFPLSAFLFFVSREAILVVYGDNWIPAIKPFQILSLTVCSQMLLSSAGAIFQAVNSTRLFFAAGCFCTFYMLSGFIIAIYLECTIDAVAWGFLCAQIFNFVTSFFLLNRALKSSFFGFLKILITPFIIGIVLFVFFYIIDNLFSINIWISFFVKLYIFCICEIMILELFTDYKPILLIQKFIRR